ncbi:glycosyltransferase family 39 protein [Patescibacteria group bacterium]|nr:glycosyltransferase family 39 protein [Patescibacteria group bacterium]
MKPKLLLFSIVIFAFFLRVLFINSSPPALYGDELTITLDVYSIIKTGNDQLGNFLPLTFNMSAGRPAGYVYGSIPFVAIFGPTALGVRALSILSGIGIIILLYLFGRKLFSEKVGLMAAAVGAISPWEISLSRGGFEAHFALFLAFLGTYLFILARKKPMLYIFSALSFGLTLHTYLTYKVAILLFLPLLFWYQDIIKKVIQENKKPFLVGIFVFIILGVLSFSQTFLAGSENRFFNINIFSQSSVKDKIEQKINFERQITKLPRPLAKYFHNKPIEYTKVFIENYLQNFSVDFLILHGDRNPRHNMATTGGIYFVELMLIFIGLATFWYKERRTILFLVFWLILAPIPTAIVDTPHALRSAFMLPPLILLSAAGLVTVFNYKNKLFAGLILLFFVIQFIFFIQKLYFLAPKEYSNFWSYSARLASEIAQENKDKYNYVILSDRIDNMEFAYPVYAKIDPRLVISQNNERALLGDNRVKRFDNVYIGYIPETQIEKFINSLDGSVFYIGSPGDKRFLTNPEIINDLDGLEALVLEKRL